MVNPIRLQARDHQILGHLRRYRISTPQVLWKLFFDGRKLDAVTSTVRRLRGANLVRSAKLNRRQSYLFLTREGAREAGMPSHLAGPLGEQSLVENYGILGFCCLGSEQREKLLPEEFESGFEELARDGIDCAPCYISETGSGARLGCIAVDQGANTRTLLRKFRRWIADRSLSAVFRSYLLEDALLLSVATSQPTKRAELLRLASKTDLPVRLYVEVVPGLAGLTSRTT